jgi:hypothetical protein
LWRLWWFTPNDTEEIHHPMVKKVQELYFACKSGDQDKTGNNINAAVVVAIFRCLAHWQSQKMISQFLFFDRTEGSTCGLLLLLKKMDCHNSKPKHTIIYHNIPWALRYIEHDDSLPFPKPPLQWTMHEEESTKNCPEKERGTSGSSVDPHFTKRTVLHLYRNLNIMLYWETSLFRRFRRKYWHLFYKDRILLHKNVKKKVSYRKC